jgi:hypothetical protein
MSQFLLSLMVGIFVGGASGYLGTLMLSKRMALVAGPLGHLTLPGIALALIYGFDISLSAFPFVILGIIFIWLLEMRTKLPMEAFRSSHWLFIFTHWASRSSISWRYFQSDFWRGRNFCHFNRLHFLNNHPNLPEDNSD